MTTSLDRLVASLAALLLLSGAGGKPSGPDCSEENPEICQRACKRGHQPSCAGLGLLHARGAGVPKDLPEAVRLLRGACDAKVPLGCGGLGSLYSAGLGVAKDPKKARDLFAGACDGGDALSCESLGGLYAATLDLGNPNPEAAAPWYEKGCRLGSQRSCLALGAMLEDGVKTVRAGAWNTADLFKGACDADLASGCLFLARKYEAGQGVPVDRKKAGELREKACRLGSKRACEEAGKGG